MNTKHTPGPYYRDLTLLCAGTPNSLSNSTIVAEFRNAADASFAMRACNSHDALLAALREIADSAPALPAKAKSGTALRAIARAAIAKAEGVTKP